MQRAPLALGLLLAAAAVSPAQTPALPDAPQSAPASAADELPSTAWDCCGRALPRIWGGKDYLFWWVRAGPTPPLVVTGAPTDPFPGALDQPGTRVLFGDQGLRYGSLNGFRLFLGAWLDPDCTLGVEGSGFALEQGHATYSAQGNAGGQPFLATPFVNALTGNNNVYFIAQNFANPALSAFLTGGVSVASATNLWSWEVHGVANLARTATTSADLLLGFRETSLREDLSYTTNVSNLSPAGASLFLTTPIAPGFQVATFDKFATSNLFNGGQAGLRIRRTWDLVSLEAVGKLALGNMHEAVAIAGATTTNAPLPVTQAAGGIYTQSTNIGMFHRDVVAVIPEVGLNASVQLTSYVRARLGYTFLYLSNVVRPGDQIDPVLNVNHVPIDAAYGTPGGPARPAFDMHGSGFWAQGINIGLEVRY